MDCDTEDHILIRLVKVWARYLNSKEVICPKQAFSEKKWWSATRKKMLVNKHGGWEGVKTKGRLSKSSKFSVLRPLRVAPTLFFFSSYQYRSMRHGRKWSPPEFQRHYVILGSPRFKLMKFWPRSFGDLLDALNDVQFQHTVPQSNS